MGISYQTRNRLRRKVMTAPLTAPKAPPAAPEPVQRPAAVPNPWRAWWPAFAAGAVAATALVSLYR